MLNFSCLKIKCARHQRSLPLTRTLYFFVCFCVPPSKLPGYNNNKTKLAINLYLTQNLKSKTHATKACITMKDLIAKVNEPYHTIYW